jgi:hypothetical protein
MKNGNNICPHCNSPIQKLEVDDIIFTIDGIDNWLGVFNHELGNLAQSRRDAELI